MASSSQQSSPSPITGFKLAHKLETGQDKGSSWRVWLDVDPALLETVETIRYSSPDAKLQPKTGEAADRFSALFENGSGITVQATITLKDFRELLLVHKITPEQGDATNKPDKSALIRTARAALLGEERSSDYLKSLYKQMEAIDQFDYASELLLIKIAQDKALGKKPPLSDYQTLVKYIYKDNSLSSDFKFDRAIRELNSADSLVDSGNCESIGLAGAIYKRKWQSDHQYRHLALSLYYYDRGYKLWRGYIERGGDLKAKHDHNDEGWNAINYAYILEFDTINRLEETGEATGFKDFEAHEFHKAQETRKFILEQFLTDPFSNPQLRNPDCEPWILATIAEAYFGLSIYEYATSFIEKYKSNYLTEPWKLRTFSQQIFSIAYLQQARKNMCATASTLQFKTVTEAGDIDTDLINQCLNALDIKGNANLKNTNYGKAGLALSGGGFRASLFHIGVLAALAERDELKDIEVISCVSGGSIIGAYYYLKLKLLLEEKNEAIEREDYIQLVREIETDFLEGVQKNLRMRIFSNLDANLKMLSKDYSRTNRLGELYEEFLYKPIFEAQVKKLKEAASRAGLKYEGSKYDELVGKDARPINMSDLFITPHPNFSMDTDNWKRTNKVPQLILNATSVNTGHNWQFTASWMGEPPADIIHDIDVKSRLRRMYYRDAPSEEYQKFRLGYAVGASSCVPVMFEPLPLNNLYPGIDLQLIDGGLHDNQGIAAILDQECKNVLISDASGQLPTNNDSVSNLLSLFMRADNILQERLRELQFLDIKERWNTTLINRLHQVHLKNGINAISVNWKNCTDPPRTISYVDPNIKDKSLMPYGVLRNIQQPISEIRTDLDAFHDIEAYALMYDGYAQTHHAMKQTDDGNEEIACNRDWKFLAITEYLTDPAKADTILKLLSISAKVPFKVYELLGGRRLGFAILAVIAAAAVTLSWIYRHEILGPHTFSGLTIAIAIAVFVAGLIWKPAGIALNPKGYLQKIAWRLGVAVLAGAVFGFYVRFLNGIYLRAGKIRK